MKSCHSSWQWVVSSLAGWAHTPESEMWRSFSKDMDESGKSTWRMDLALWLVRPCAHFVFMMCTKPVSLHLQRFSCFPFNFLGIWWSQRRGWCCVWTEWQRTVQWKVRVNYICQFVWSVSRQTESYFYFKAKRLLLAHDFWTVNELNFIWLLSCESSYRSLCSRVTIEHARSRRGRGGGGGGGGGGPGMGRFSGGYRQSRSSGSRYEM